jgi:hypothetical protein
MTTTDAAACGGSGAADNDADLMRAWREARAEEDRIAGLLAAAKAVREDVEHKIADVFRARGVFEDGYAVRVPGLTATVRTKFRPTYEPEKWTGIVDWASRTGNYAVLQRRLGERAILALVDAGAELPDGLGVEGFKELSFTRS